MTIEDFRKSIEGEQLVYNKEDAVVYKIEKKTYNDLHGWRRDHMFFYFVDDKLNSMDKGEKAVDYRIRID